MTPFDCLFCGAEGLIVCKQCQNGLVYPLVSRCYRCRQATVQHATCATCRQHTALKYLWVGTELNEVTKKLLYAFKFERAQEAHRVVARIMSGRLPALNDKTLIVPVPTATSRVRRRGYDHTRLLAKEIAQNMNLNCGNHLVRLNQTRQVGATRQARREQLTDAFRVLQTDQLKDKNILLVDDVLTTGATLEEAARALKSKGVRQVGAVVFAHKV